MKNTEKIRELCEQRKTVYAGRRALIPVKKIYGSLWRFESKSNGRTYFCSAYLETLSEKPIDKK